MYTQKRCMKLLFLSAFFILVFSLSASAAPKLAKKKLTLKTGNAYVLQLKNNTQTPKWTSSKKSVVQIVWTSNDRAVLRAKKAGSSKITAQIGKKKLTCKVTVKKDSSFPKSKTVIVGDTVTLSKSKKGTWSVNSNILKLSSTKGKKVKVTARQPGTATVSLTIGKKIYKCNKDSIELLHRRLPLRLQIPTMGQTAADPVPPFPMGILGTILKTLLKTMILYPDRKQVMVGISMKTNQTPKRKSRSNRQRPNRLLTPTRYL